MATTNRQVESPKQTSTCWYELFTIALLIQIAQLLSLANWFVRLDNFAGGLRHADKSSALATTPKLNRRHNFFLDKLVALSAKLKES
jgi:hypothetical protein